VLLVRFSPTVAMDLQAEGLSSVLLPYLSGQAFIAAYVAC
jgi:hypothetical protein